MKKVINRKIYDTDTAELLHEWSNGNNYTDFNWYEEKLYVTEKGAFFLYGDGGPSSKWGKAGLDYSYAASDIVVLSKENALDWLEGHDGEDVIDEYFTDEIEEA